MTTRFKPDNLMEGLFGAVHEAGHSMYEQGRNTTPEFQGTDQTTPPCPGGSMHACQIKFVCKTSSLSIVMLQCP